LARTTPTNRDAQVPHGRVDCFAGLLEFAGGVFFEREYRSELVTAQGTLHMLEEFGTIRRPFDQGRCFRAGPVGHITHSGVCENADGMLVLGAYGTPIPGSAGASRPGLVNRMAVVRLGDFGLDIYDGFATSEQRRWCFRDECELRRTFGRYTVQGSFAHILALIREFGDFSPVTVLFEELCPPAEFDYDRFDVEESVIAFDDQVGTGYYLHASPEWADYNTTDGPSDDFDWIETLSEYAGCTVYVCSNWWANGHWLGECWLSHMHRCPRYRAEVFRSLSQAEVAGGRVWTGLHFGRA